VYIVILVVLIDHPGEGDRSRKSQLPDKPVEITLEGPDILKKRYVTGFSIGTGHRPIGLIQLPFWPVKMDYYNN
jgi:hypothetical protein